MLTTLITRACQLLFTAIVLGLSISALRWQLYGSVPATTSYNAFAGAFGLLGALIGLAAIWVSAIPELIMSAVDAVASILLLAGGIVSGTLCFLKVRYADVYTSLRSRSPRRELRCFGERRHGLYERVLERRLRHEQQR